MNFRIFTHLPLISLLLCGSDWTRAEAIPSPELQCDPPHWAAPAESIHGLFRGNLLMECSITPVKGRPDLQRLKAGFEQKIQLESKIFAGPKLSLQSSVSTLTWDLSHTLNDNGTQVIIREEAELLTDFKDHFVYRTHSKNVSAEGLASFLRSVNFSMNLTIRPMQSIQINFQNEVEVQRPWYALDLIFAPIARGICFQKMEQVKEKILPWAAQLLLNQGPLL